MMRSEQYRYVANIRYAVRTGQCKPARALLATLLKTGVRANTVRRLRRMVASCRVHSGSIMYPSGGRRR